MPIEVEGGPLRVFSQEEFQELDYEVMGIVFDVHNEFGRLFDELLYKREIAARCAARGIPTERELCVRVSRGTFVKKYAIDLVFSHGVIYEVKAVDRLAPAHQAQTLNYLLLTGTHHAKLVNLRPERVSWRFVSTQLSPELRKQVTIDDRAWCDIDDRSRLLKHAMVDLLGDWGAFLECNLYRDALIHFLGGEEAVIHAVPIYSEDRVIGHQSLPLVTEGVTMAVTAVTGSAETMRAHLGRLLSHTPLRHLHWINLNHHRVEFVTLSK